MCFQLLHQRILKSQELFDVVEANFQGPPPGKNLQDLRGRQGEVGGEEAIVAAATAGIVDNYDTQQSGSGTGIP